MAINNAKYIFIKRDLYDIILRIYMYKYISENSFSTDVKTIIEYINWYYELIDIYMAKYPDICRVVSYEEMIENPRSVIDTASELCGVENAATDQLPSIGDDRGVAGPYRERIKQALGG